MTDPRLDLPRVPFAAGDDIASIVLRLADEIPGRTALVEGAAVLTWGELGARVDRIAAALVSRGTSRGDRVAVLASNSTEYVAIFVGALRAGASVVPLPTLASAEALGLMVADACPTALFAGEAYRSLAAGLPLPGSALRVGVDFEDAEWISLAAWLATAPPHPPPIALGPDDEFDVLYSSGTTGVPKGIVHSHGARKSSYAGSRAAYFSRQSVNVIATPFYSNTTCITWLLTMAAGGASVLLGKFSAEAFLAAVERHRATHAMLVPVQYERILGSDAFPRTDCTSLRHLFSTSAPLRAETKRRILDETGAELVEIYGLTEGGPVTVLEARQHPDKLASVGAAARGTELRILDESGKDVPPGQAGEVVGRSSNMMQGYLNRPEETAAMLWRDARGTLYFRTGDVGRLDQDGFLYLLDRKKDVIISGGFNVYATDLEAVLARHPAVAEVAVIAVPSERWGETPLALVVPGPGANVTAEELLTFCNARVGKAQRVSAVELKSELPKNAIGKVLKRELREGYRGVKGD